MVEVLLGCSILSSFPLSLSNVINDVRILFFMSCLFSGTLQQHTPTVYLEYQLPEPKTRYIHAYLIVATGVVLSNNNYIQKHVFRKTQNILPWTPMT